MLVSMFSQVVKSLQLCLLLGLLNLSIDNTKADDATLSKFRNEAPSAWQQIRQAYSDKEFERHSKRVDMLSISVFPKPVVVSEEIGETFIARSNNHLRIRRKAAKKKPARPPEKPTQTLEMVEETTEGTEILNTKYLGNLTADSPAKLDYYEPLGDDQASEKSKLGLDYETIPALRLGNTVIDRSIVGFPYFSEVEGHANYVVKDAEEFTRNNDTLVRVTLRLGILKNGNLISTSPHMVEGVVVLDPSRNWCAVEYHEKFDNSEGNPDSNLDVIITPRSKPGLFHPLKIETNNAFSDGVQWTTSEEFTPLVGTDLTEDECYFSAYGLPEPAEFRRSWLTTGILLAIVCVLLFLVIIRRRRAENLSTQ